MDSKTMVFHSVKKGTERRKRYYLALQRIHEQNVKIPTKCHSLPRSSGPSVLETANGL